MPLSVRLYIFSRFLYCFFHHIFFFTYFSFTFSLIHDRRLLTLSICCIILLFVGTIILHWVAMLISVSFAYQLVTYCVQAYMWVLVSALLLVLFVYSGTSIAFVFVISWRQFHSHNYQSLLDTFATYCLILSFFLFWVQSIYFMYVY